MVSISLRKGSEENFTITHDTSAAIQQHHQPITHHQHSSNASANNNEDLDAAKKKRKKRRNSRKTKSGSGSTINNSSKSLTATTPRIRIKSASASTATLLAKDEDEINVLEEHFIFRMPASKPDLIHRLRDMVKARNISSDFALIFSGLFVS